MSVDESVAEIIRETLGPDIEEIKIGQNAIFEVLSFIVKKDYGVLLDDLPDTLSGFDTLCLSLEQYAR